MHGITGSRTSYITHEKLSEDEMQRADTHTGIENEGGSLQIKSEGDSVGTDGDAFSDTIMVVDFVTVVLQLGGGGEELTKVNTSVGATIVNTRVDQSLEQNIRSPLNERSGGCAPDGLPQVSYGVMDRGIGLPSG